MIFVFGIINFQELLKKLYFKRFAIINYYYDIVDKLLIN